MRRWGAARLFPSPDQLPTPHTLCLIHASSRSAFLLKSCRLRSPPRALLWLAAVCFRSCHWSCRASSCLRTPSVLGLARHISCSPICGAKGPAQHHGLPGTPHCGEPWDMGAEGNGSCATTWPDLVELYQRVLKILHVPLQGLSHLLPVLEVAAVLQVPQLAAHPALRL